MTVALDSNVFIAYLAQDDAFYESAQRIISQISSGKMAAVYSSLVFGEVVYPVSKPETLAAVNEFFKQLVNARDVPANAAICQRASVMQLAERSLKLPAAIHLATAIEAQAN